MKMNKMIFSFLFLGFFICLNKPLHAQASYKDVTEQIHYTDANRDGGNKSKQIGASNPKVKIFIYSNLTNSFSDRFFETIYPTLQKNHPNDVLFIYRHNYLDTTNPSAEQGEIISECAAKQGRFWDNVVPIYNNKDNLDSINYLIDVNDDDIKTCIQDPLIKSSVETDRSDAKLFGFNAIPLFIVENAEHPEEYAIKISGAQDISVFEQAIKEVKNENGINQTSDQLKNELNQKDKDLQIANKKLAEANKKIPFYIIEFDKIKAFFQSLFAHK